MPKGRCGVCSRGGKYLVGGACRTCRRIDAENDAKTEAELDAMIASNYATMPDKRHGESPINEAQSRAKFLARYMVRQNSRWRGYGYLSRS